MSGTAGMARGQSKCTRLLYCYSCQQGIKKCVKLQVIKAQYKKHVKTLHNYTSYQKDEVGNEIDCCVCASSFSTAH